MKAVHEHTGFPRTCVASHYMIMEHVPVEDCTLAFSAERNQNLFVTAINGLRLYLQVAPEHGVMTSHTGNRSSNIAQSDDILSPNVVTSISCLQNTLALV